MPLPDHIRLGRVGTHFAFSIKMAAASSKDNVDFSIKPEAVTPSIPTSEWPLLLKNYDKRKCWATVLAEEYPC